VERVTIPVGGIVRVTPSNVVRGPEYRAKVVGYNTERTKYHLGAQIGPHVYAKGGSWAYPHEVSVVL
jgi:hypothetical protein